MVILLDEMVRHVYAMGYHSYQGGRVIIEWSGLTAKKRSHPAAVDRHIKALIYSIKVSNQKTYTKNRTNGIYHVKYYR
jgi:hypothetical protein